MSEVVELVRLSEGGGVWSCDSLAVDNITDMKMSLSMLTNTRG